MDLSEKPKEHQVDLTRPEPSHQQIRQLTAADTADERANAVTYHWFSRWLMGLLDAWLPRLAVLWPPDGAPIVTDRAV